MTCYATEDASDTSPRVIIRLAPSWAPSRRLRPRARRGEVVDRQRAAIERTRSSRGSRPTRR